MRHPLNLTNHQIILWSSATSIELMLNPSSRPHGPQFLTVSCFTRSLALLMAELGIVSGVAGLISLGITVCKGILAYYDAFKGSGDAIEKMCASMENVAKTLLVISSTVTRGSFDKIAITMVETSVSGCANGMDALAKKLEKIRSVRADGTLKARVENAKRQTIYPFKESTLVKMREVCDDLRDNLALAIGALNV
jgi:hypothetical protein